MPKAKSFLPIMEVDFVKRAHNCQHNSSHRLLRDEKRLKVKVGRTYEYFCVACAIDSINRDVTKLQSLLIELM